MIEKMQQAEVAASSMAASVNGGFFGRFADNILASGRAPKKCCIGFVLAWAAFFLVLWAMPLPPGLSPAGKATLAVMVWASIMWIAEAMPVGIVGLLIPMLLTLTGAVKAFPAAASGFTTPVVFLCLSAFLFAAVMQAVGLDRRIALSLLHLFKVKTVNGAIWAMFVVNYVISWIIPAANSRAATLLPVINGITRMFGDTPQENIGKKAIVIQTLVYGSMICGMSILTAHLPNLVLVGLFQNQLHLDISVLDWLILQWPYLLMFVITQWWVQYYFRTRNVGIKGGFETVQVQYRELPKMSQNEWMIVAVLAFVALLWVTEPINHIKPFISALIGVALLFFPGLLGFKWKELQDRTMWGTFLLLAGALSMSKAMQTSGLAQWLSDRIHPLAEGHPWWMVLLILMVGTHIIRLGMLSNVAAITMLAPVLLALAPKLGLHPVAFTMLVSDTDTFAYILPTQITAAVIAYGTNTFSMADYAKVGWLSVLIAIAFGIVIMTHWYAFLGMPLWDPTAPWPFKH